ncbi:MAG: polysaccharide deacetylase family protein [Clostridia bacterium]|nr:polysaccharide deacetylase family protein [Clostridia bacterium]
MTENDQNRPEFLQIKGYKYRAKMLIAAGIILLLLIYLITLAVNGISSEIHGGKSASDTDSDSLAAYNQSADSQSPDSNTDPNSSVQSSDPQTSSSSSDLAEKESFDADGKLIINGDKLNGKKAVAITFDDGPGEYTQRLIEGLNSRGAKATFFMVGSCVEKYPEVLPMMAGGGHQLGNHTYNHTDITSVSTDEMNDQISKTDKAIYDACGQTSTAFRPPYGSCSDATNRLINKTITLWSVDSMDWNNRDAESIKNTIVSQCHDGDIILLHDIYSTSVDGALAAIDELQQQGFVFVTVNDLLTRYGYEIEKGKAHSSQYAVFETNSPYAEQYLKEIEQKKAAQASSSAAGSFYYESSSKEEKPQSTDTDSDSIPIIPQSTDTEKKRLIY